VWAAVAVWHGLLGVLGRRYKQFPMPCRVLRVFIAMAIANTLITVYL
jgi:hypothetical protein